MPADSDSLVRQSLEAIHVRKITLYGVSGSATRAIEFFCKEQCALGRIPIVEYHVASRSMQVTCSDRTYAGGRTGDQCYSAIQLMPVIEHVGKLLIRLGPFAENTCHFPV